MGVNIDLRAWHTPLGPESKIGQEMITGDPIAILSLCKKDPSNYVIERYIGFRDGKHNQKIYENDIVAINDSHTTITGDQSVDGIKGIVKFDSDNAQFVVQVKKRYGDFADLSNLNANNIDTLIPFSPFTHEQITVLGNIHENPEQVNEG